MSHNIYNEATSSQLPALQLLISMGWQHLSPDEVIQLRSGKEANIVLTAVLEPWLRQHNTISYKG